MIETPKEDYEKLCAEFGFNPSPLGTGEIIRPENFTVDSLHRATKDGQRCKVELNNGDILETSSLCSIHMIDGNPTGLGLDATGTFKANSTQMPADMSAFAAQIVTIPLVSIKTITLLASEQNHPAPSLDRASF